MRRRKNTTEEGGVDLGIIITPMLDMAFQLLAFFIITFHPATSEAAIDGTLLPAVNASASAGQREQLSVIVQAGQGGEPTAVYCKHNGNLKLLRLVKTPDDFALALQTLGDELATYRKSPRDKDPAVCLEAARSLPYGQLIAVQENIRAAGFTNIELRAISGGEK